MHIENIAEVISGYTFRKAITPDKNGNILVFQAKNIIQGELFLDTDGLTRVSHEVSGHTNYLKKNDVLIVSRGMKSGSFRSTVFMTEEQNVVASSSIHIVRITDKKVFPEYVSHYLNSNYGQKSLSENISGSYIGSLPRKELERIKIPIPDLKKQKAIIDLYRNIKEQEKITNRKKQIKDNIINSTFKNLID